MSFISAIASINGKRAVNQAQAKRTEIEQKMERLEAMNAELAPLVAEFAKLKAEVKADVAELGEAVEHGNVKASLRAGYTRTSWNASELNAIDRIHPELKISECKTSTNVRPSVSISVG